MVLENGVHQLFAEGVRRDRAVGAGSERALILPGDEGGEQLALSIAPVFAPAKSLVRDVGEALPKKLRPIEDGSNHVRWALSSHELDCPQHEIAREAMPRLQAA